MHIPWRPFQQATSSTERSHKDYDMNNEFIKSGENARHDMSEVDEVGEAVIFDWTSPLINGKEY